MIFPSLEVFNDLAKQFNIIPVWLEMAGDLYTPVSIFRKWATEEGVFLLESVEQHEKVGRYSLIGRQPFLEIKAYGERIQTITNGECIERRGFPLQIVEEIMTAYRSPQIKDLPPFCGGAVGHFAYDAVRYIEKLPNYTKDSLEVPDIHLMVFNHVAAYDHVKNRVMFVVNVQADENAVLNYRKAAQELEKMKDEYLAHLERDTTCSLNFLSESENLHFRSNMTKDQYCEKVCQAKSYIKAGDIFQVVLSQCMTANARTHPFEVYRRLRYTNPSPYMYYIHFGDYQVVGSSPETLIKVKDGIAETNPIAGTRPRGRNDQEDEVLAAELLADPKEIAEHMMLVDLGRNDIGRIAEFGTMQLPHLLQIEKYSHVMHIVSRVSGKLKSDYTAFDALAACLPAGTVSGAPKVRAMEIIEGLEADKRGVYAGAVGYISFTGEMDMCIAIRTLVFKGGMAYIQAGAGIVADSIPEKEYEETLRKATALLNVL